MCWLFSCTSTVSFVFCMSGLNAIEKDTVKILHFDCDFAYFFSFCQVYFKVMFCYLSWILMSICLLRVHLIMIMKIPSLIQLVFSSVQFSCSVVSDSLWRHGLQHARPPCLSLTPRVYANSCLWVSNAIQPPHPLLSPSPPALNLSQHQGLFKWVSSLHQVAKVLEFQLQHQSFQRIPRTGLL